MGKRGPARDRMTEPAANAFRRSAKSVRDLFGVTNEQIAERIPKWNVQRVVHALAPGRPLRIENAEKVQQALRSLTPPRFRNSEALSKAVEALLGTLDPPHLVPPALIPVHHIPTVVAFLVRNISRPGIRRKQLALALERTLKSTAQEMAQQAYQFNRTEQWIDDEGAAALLRAFGFEVPTDSSLVYEKKRSKV